MKQVKSQPFGYWGGKSTIAPILDKILLYKDGYAEPCIGGGAMYFYRNPVKYEVMSDMDGRLTSFYRVIRDRKEDLIEKIMETPHSEVEFKACAGDYDHLDELEQARRIWVRVVMGMHMKTSDHNTYARPIVHGKDGIRARFRSEEAIRETFKYAQRRMRRTSFLQRDILETLDACNDESFMVYIDPPYFDDVGKGGYKHEEIDHEAVAKACHESKASIAISGYPTETGLYLYGDWERIDYSKLIGAGGNFGKGENDGALPDRTESIWVNYSQRNTLI